MTAICILLLAFSMFFLREGTGFNPVQLMAPVLLFLIGVVLSWLLKPVLE